MLRPLQLEFNQSGCLELRMIQQDASWILGSLKCSTPGHVLLLLKSSDRICSDFNRVYPHPFISLRRSSLESVSPVIALQRWCNYFPSMEFCLYIREGVLKAVSQRDTSVFYPFLVTEKESICSLLCDFVRSRVQNRFPVEQCEGEPDD